MSQKGSEGGLWSLLKVSGLAAAILTSFLLAPFASTAMVKVLDPLKLRYSAGPSGIEFEYEAKPEKEESGFDDPARNRSTLRSRPGLSSPRLEVLFPKAEKFPHAR